MKRMLFGIFAVAVAAAQGETDWARLNVAAWEHAKTSIRAGVPGVRPFWNAHAKAFIHPPAFEFQEVKGTTEYRFTLMAHNDGKEPNDLKDLKDPKDPKELAITWTAPKPWLPIPADIWDSLKPGYYRLRVTGAGPGVTSVAGERTFYRAAVFQGPYPKGACDYRTAARRVYAAVYNLPQVQGWKTSDDPPKGYDLYCYPAKIMGSMIRALVRHARGGSQFTATEAGAINCAPPDSTADARERVPPDAADALAVACKMADWLSAHCQPAGAPLAYFPPTYWGDRRQTAVQYAGQNMLLYPAHAALAYLDLADVMCHAGNGADPQKYRAAALAIARTYAKLQGTDGTWPLKVREKDGSPVRANRLVPGRYILGLFDNLSFEPSVAVARDRAFGYVLNGPVKTWNWDGQFEDMDPMPPYKNLQKGCAVDTALRFFAQGRIAEGCELVDWCEDQFVVWSDPIHNMDWKHWKTPTALEQYDYYTPIDASMGDMIGAFAAAYKATGNSLYLEKAKALADNITRNQRPDGTIPTYFDSRKGSDWVNCMIYVADRLEALADGMEK